ncbi:MAG: hypothetical protein FWF63_00775 [Fibromonadales bacterium]|nr:hypothetical protein [Fibromonadales bacterium]
MKHSLEKNVYLEYEETVANRRRILYENSIVDLCYTLKGKKDFILGFGGIFNAFFRVFCDNRRHGGHGQDVYALSFQQNTLKSLLSKNINIAGGDLCLIS